MGLTVSDAISIIEVTKNIKKGSVLCLGEQLLGYSVDVLIKSKKKYKHSVNLDNFIHLDKKKILNQKLFFNTLGFDNIDTLDVDDYEGANIIFDLNDNITPENLINKYDFIYDGGTLEHVFNIGNALKHLTKMTKKRGFIFHSNPCNGYIDHGFFQISPTLYFDYYLSNGFKIVFAHIVEKSIGRKIYPVRQDLYRTLDQDFGSKYTPKGVLNFCTQNTKESEEIITPQQGYYISKWKNNNQTSYKVEKHITLNNYKTLIYFFTLWLKTPYYILRKLKSIKKKLK